MKRFKFPPPTTFGTYLFLALAILVAYGIARFLVSDVAAFAFAAGVVVAVALTDWIVGSRIDLDGGTLRIRRFGFLSAAVVVPFERIQSARLLATYEGATLEVTTADGTITLGPWRSLLEGKLNRRIAAAATLINYRG